MHRLSELSSKCYGVKYQMVQKTKSAQLPDVVGAGVTVVVRVGTAAKENTY